MDGRAYSVNGSGLTQKYLSFNPTDQQQSEVDPDPSAAHLN